MQAEVLVQLIPFLSESKRERVLQEAVEAAKYSKYRDSTLETLAPHLSKRSLRKTLKNLLNWDDFPGGVLSSFFARLSELGSSAEAFHIAVDTRSSNKREHILAAVVPHLPNHLLSQALEQVLKLENSYVCETLLAALYPRIAKLDDGMEALKHIRQFKQKENRVKALSKIAPHLQGSEREQVLREALETSLDPSSKPLYMYMAWLAPSLAQCPFPILYQFWQNILTSLSTRSRQEIIPALLELSPVIYALGGTQAVVETFHAIQDVGSWWS